jgi:hypothetical protein
MANLDDELIESAALLMRLVDEMPPQTCADGTALQTTKLEAPTSAPRSVQGAQPVASGFTPVLARVEAPSSAEEQPRSQKSQQRLVDSPRPTIERGSASSGAAPTIVRRVARTTAQAWLAGAATLFFLAFLFWFAASRPRAIKISSDTAAVPLASGATGRDVAGMGPMEAKAQNPVEAHGPKSPDHSSPAGVPLSTGSVPSSKAEEEKSGAGGSPRLRAVPVEQVKAMASNLSPQPGDSPAAVPRESPGTASGDRKVGSPASRALAAEGAKLEPFELPTEPAKAASLAVTPPIPPPIKSASISRPDFVLDRTLKAHSSWVTGVAFSSDGQRLASGSWDQTVKLWDVSTGKELSTVGSKMEEVQALAFSRDGHWLAAENSSNTVTLWDAKTGREVHRLPSNKPLGVLGSSWVYSIAFSPDGRWLASGVDDKTVRVWDVSTGRKLRDLAALRRSVIYAAFSPDGRWLASGDGDKNVRIWEVSTGQEIRRLSGHKKPIYAVAFSPNGHWLASASADKSIKLWDFVTGREVHTLTGHGNLVTSLAFSPDGRWLASGSWDKTIKIWDVETGREAQTLGGHGHSIYTVAFDSSGHWLASGSEDGTINLWRLSGGPGQTRLR